jgi:hypothetical protein
MASFRILSALGASLLLAACGPTGKTGETGPGSGDGSGSSGAGPQDDQLTYDTVKLPGTYFTPEGLDRPGMLLARGKKKTTLDKQRAAVKKAKGEALIGESSILATMLYDAAQKEPDDAKHKALLEEARKALSDAAAAAPDAADALLLHDLACLSYDAGDQAGAIAALSAAIQKAPTDAGTAERKAYLAYYLVRAGKNAEAGAAVDGLTASKDQPEMAYAIAWAKWRTGDLPAARAAMLAAVQGWKNGGFVPAIKHDTLVFGARTGGSVDEAVALSMAYVALVKDDPKMKGDAGTLAMLVQMHQSFAFAGRIADSITLVDKIFEMVKSLGKPDALALRLQQADASKSLGRQEDLVKYVTEASELLKSCGSACDAKITSDAAKAIFNLARFSNYLYTTSQDDRWYTAGKSLYTIYLGIPGITDAAAVQGEASTLENAHAHAKKNAGTHDKNATDFVLQDYAAQVVGCYDASVQQDPTLAGTVKLSLEVAATGEVSGATTDPAGGKEGLAAVASCVTDAARAWVFPARTHPGVTRISISYALAPASK